MKPKINGFTLIELLIVIAVVGILATIAVAVYGPFVLEGRRSDGINALLSLSLAEERYSFLQYTIRYLN